MSVAAISPMFIFLLILLLNEAVSILFNLPSILALKKLVSVLVIVFILLDKLRVSALFSFKLILVLKDAVSVLFNFVLSALVIKVLVGLRLSGVLFILSMAKNSFKSFKLSKPVPPWLSPIIPLMF